MIVTGDFVAAVNSLKNRLGFKNLQDSPYEQTRSHVMAVAKTMACSSNGTLGFLIIVDSQAFDDTVFKQWAPEGRTLRQYYIGHELVHVGDMAVEATAIGLEKFLDASTWIERRKFLNAGSMWQEYHAVRLITESAAPWSHEFERSQGYQNSFARLLTELPDFLKPQIAAFRLWRMNVEQYLEKVMPRLRQLLVLWTYTLAMEDAGVAIAQDFKTLPVYKMALAPYEPKIDALLRRMYGDPWKYHTSELGSLGDILDRVFEGCSLRFGIPRRGSIYLDVLDVAF